MLLYTYTNKEQNKMAKDESVDTIDMFEDMEEQDIQPELWYLVSSQGVEYGPFATYREAKSASSEGVVPMYGEQILDMLDEDDWDLEGGW